MTATNAAVITYMVCTGPTLQGGECSDRWLSPADRFCAIPLGMTAEATGTFLPCRYPYSYQPMRVRANQQARMQQASGARRNIRIHQQAAVPDLYH